MLTFPIVDTHVHLWDISRFDYAWVKNVPFLNRSFVLSDFDAARGATDIGGMVFVTCVGDTAQWRDEIAWVQSLASDEPRLKGIVGCVPVTDSQTALADLEAVRSRSGLLKGLRPWHRPMDDPKYVDFVRCLGRLDLTCDICVPAEELADAARLFTACPDVRFVLDHVGNPDIRKGSFEQWCRDLAEVAKCPHVTCKISGLATRADHDNWTREQLKPCIDYAIGCFGFDRVTFGGDWPVAAQAIEYPQWVQTVTWAVEGCSDSEKRKLFRDNAVGVYHLRP